MSYGLYDGDLPLYDRFPFLNLELMKLATYYKNKREIVSLTQDFIPQKYSHFIVRQDYFNPNANYPYYKHVEFGGKAFNGPIYKPMALEIEECRPDVSIYNNIKTTYKFTQNDSKAFHTMRNAIHLRLSLDGRTIWSNFSKQLPNDKGHSGLIFHDDNLENITDSQQIIQELLERLLPAQLQRIGTKYPIQVESEDRYISWLRFLAINQFYSLQYNGIPCQESLEEIATITKNSTRLPQTTLNVTANTTYEKFITQDIVSIMRNSAILCTYKAQIPLIYDDTFFIDKRWADVTWIIQQYIAFLINLLHKRDRVERVIPYETLYNYYNYLIKKPRHTGLKVDKQFIQETFQFVRLNNYELFTLFYKPIKEIANEARRN